MEVYTTKALAAKLSVRPQRIREYVRDGELTGFKIGQEWRFTEEDVSRFIERQRQARTVERIR